MAEVSSVIESEHLMAADAADALRPSGLDGRLARDETGRAPEGGDPSRVWLRPQGQEIWVAFA